MITEYIFKNCPYPYFLNYMGDPENFHNDIGGFINSKVRLMEPIRVLKS